MDDPPTDAYDLFNYIWHCKKLYSQIEEWAKEDYAERRMKATGPGENQCREEPGCPLFFAHSTHGHHHSVAVGRVETKAPAFGKAGAAYRVHIQHLTD